jgi:hypothetical protein
VLESGIRWIFRKATRRDKGGDYCWSAPGARYDNGRKVVCRPQPQDTPHESAPDDSAELPAVRER